MIEQSRIEAFVGKKTDYYFEKWQSIEDESSSRVSFNLAAFFLSAFWLVYRKLYVQLTTFFLVLFADIGISVYLEDAGIASSTVIAMWDRVSPIVYGTVVGLWGNHWYFRKFQRFDSLASSESLDPANQEAFLRAKGGTNVVGAWIFVSLFVALFVALTAYT